MQSELKPCPFCGGEARLWSVIMPFDADCDSITVQCADCDATGADVLVDQDVHSQSDLVALEAEAIAAWNTRASDAERREPDANENPYSRARLNSENTKLRAEITRLTEALRAAEEREKGLREDLKRAEVEEVIAHCEGCSAPLLSKDDFVSDDDCVYGCFAAMTDAPPHREWPCYAYRVGKPAARQALAGAKP